jgi:hypothetical protein
MSDWLRGVKVPPLRIADIRRLTTSIRHGSQIEPEESFPVLEFLEISLPNVLPGFDYVITDDMPHGMEACAFPDGCTEHLDGPFIKISGQVYEAAYRGEGRARFTILHECGHVLLHRKVAVHHRAPVGADLKPFENSEWQANTFAAELLMPPDSFATCRSLDEFLDRMGVSGQAALVQGRKLQDRREINRITWL